MQTFSQPPGVECVVMCQLQVSLFPVPALKNTPHTGGRHFPLDLILSTFTVSISVFLISHANTESKIDIFQHAVGVSMS